MLIALIRLVYRWSVRVLYATTSFPFQFELFPYATLKLICTVNCGILITPVIAQLTSCLPLTCSSVWSTLLPLSFYFFRHRFTEFQVCLVYIYICVCWLSFWTFCRFYATSTASVPQTSFFTSFHSSLSLAQFLSLCVRLSLPSVHA